MTQFELTEKLEAEKTRIGIKAGPELRMFDHNTCDEMRAMDWCGRLAVSISFAFNTCIHDAPSVLKALAGFGDNSNASYEEVHDAVQNSRARR